MVLEKWHCGSCGKTWEIDLLPPGSLAQSGFGDFLCRGCGARLLDDPAMNDESTLPGLIGAPIRYREVGTVQWYEVP